MTITDNELTVFDSVWHRWCTGDCLLIEYQLFFCYKTQRLAWMLLSVFEPEALILILVYRFASVDL